MDFKEYEKISERTAPKNNLLDVDLVIGAMGLCGEAGEVSEVIKKIVFHGHKMDALKIADELGDVLWYMAHIARTIGISLETIAEMNIQKLEKRYPDGFSTEKSINREV